MTSLRVTPLQDDLSFGARITGVTHEALYRCAHNRYLLKTLTGLHDALALLGESMLHDRARAEQTLQEHAAIVEAIKRRDPDAAEQATRKHIRTAQLERIKRRFEA